MASWVSTVFEIKQFYFIFLGFPFYCLKTMSQKLLLLVFYHNQPLYQHLPCNYERCMTGTGIVGKNSVKFSACLSCLMFILKQYTDVSSFKTEINLHVSKSQQTICHLNNLVVNITSISIITLIVTLCAHYCNVCSL